MSDEPTTATTDDTPQKQYGIAWGDEIDETRKQELWARLRAWWEETDHRGRIGPFASKNFDTNARLTGADVFWLALYSLARDENIAIDDAERILRLSPEQDDFEIARLESQFHGLSHLCLQGSDLIDARLQGAKLFGAQLQEANLNRGQLQGANLVGAQLQGAKLSETRLQGAYLIGAQLQRANLIRARLQGANLFRAQLQGANLSEAFFDGATTLWSVMLSPSDVGTICFADVHWGEVNLATAIFRGTWRPPLGDELAAHKWRSQPLPFGANQQRHRHNQEANRLDLNRIAVRANRQVAVALQTQGMNEEAGQFAYHAQLMQRTVYRLEGRRALGQWLFSWFLWLIAGYGYRPGRSVAIYLASVALFAVGYFALGVTVGPHLSPYEAAVVSLTAFHGRGFFATAFKPGDPQAGLAALEAVFGLLIEISFIATFTQRFFGAK